MNSDTSTEMIVPANVSWPYLVRKNFTRDISGTANSYISIGSWVLLNGAAYFEVSIQVNTSGFTVSKSYRFSVKNDATAGAWQKIIPEVDSGISGTNDFDFLINSSTSTVSFRIRRSGGSTDGEAKIYISKYGNPDDVFTSSVATGTISAPPNYPRSLGLNAVYLTEANIFTADQTVNAKFIAKGDGVNFPSARIGAGTSGLSANSSVNGSLILQGATGGAKSQFEIISPSGGSRIILESDSTNGSLLYAQGGDLKFNAGSVSQVYYGTNSAKGVMFSSSVNSSPDIGLSRTISGVLKVNDGAAGYGSISAKNLRIKKIDYLKIDIEGAEFKALKGAKILLEKNLIENIHLEYGHAAMADRVYIKDIHDYLKNYGFKMYIIKPYNIERVYYTPYLENEYDYINLFFSKK
jgi:hypothetical protein